MKKSARLRAPFRIFRFVRRHSLSEVWSFASWQFGGWNCDFDVLAWPGSGILSLPVDRISVPAPRNARYAGQKGYKGQIVRVEHDINSPPLFVKRSSWWRRW